MVLDLVNKEGRSQLLGKMNSVGLLGPRRRKSRAEQRHLILSNKCLHSQKIESGSSAGNVLALCDGLYTLGPGGGTVGRCGLVGEGVSLWVWALRPSF